ncbi:MAG: hypothetical protein ACE5JR_07340 [Gemmatimonadota bacterium]
MNFSRTLCVLGRALDQDDGLGVYAQNLLRELFELDPATRYVLILRTPKHASRFQAFGNVETWVMPARFKAWWDHVVVATAARRANADFIFNSKFSLFLLSRRLGVFVLHRSDWYVDPHHYQWWDNLYIRMMLPVYFRKSAGVCPEEAGGAALLAVPDDPDALAEAMLELTRSRAARERLREAGLRRVRGFSWCLVAERTLEAFDRVRPAARAVHRRAEVG